MSHQIENKCLFASSVREQLDNDEFIQLLTKTTTFRNILPDKLPLATLTDICLRTELKEMASKEPLKLADEGEAVFEILSGYVKIQDRPESKADQRRGVIKSPPALLAWRVPGELLGDFRFVQPEEPGEDWIEATDDCRLLKMPTALIHDLAQIFPQIYLNIAGNLASKARKGRVRAQILRLPNIKCMVAQLFIELIQERKTSEESPGQHVLNGTFWLDDLAAFLGYEERATEGAVTELMDHELIKHYKNNVSGRYEICDPSGFKLYLEHQLKKAATEKKERKNKRKT